MATMVDTRSKTAPLKHTHQLMIIVVISLVCILVYSNTTGSPFIFDDHPNIRENPYVRITNFDLKQLYNAGFKSPNARRPVANISFALNYYLGKYHVAGYHIVNIIVHLVNGILVYFLALIIFKQASHTRDRKILQIRTGSIPLMSFFAALIFITHPVQSQSVTYIVQRMNSMAAMFYLCSLLFYIYGRLVRIKWQQWALFGGCLLSWILAIGCKEIAATLPLIILLYEWYFIQDLKTDWIRQNIKCVAGLCAVFCLMIFIFLGKNPVDNILASYAGRDFTLLERVLTQPRIVVFYISLLFCPLPSRLNLLHFFTTSHALTAPLTTLFSLLVIFSLLGFAIYIAKKQRLISFFILWFFINLIIESSVIGLEMVFEHRLYLPMFGFAALSAYFLFGVLSKQQSGAIAVSVIVILSFAAATYARNSAWQDETTLLSDIISKNPQSHRAHNNLGVVLNRQGRTKEAMDHYYQALRIKPYHTDAHYNLGNALDNQGRKKEAMDHFLQVLRITPDHTDTHNNLGVILNELGRKKEAVDHFLQALKKNPGHEEAHYNLGNALNEQGRKKEAMNHYYQALRIKPDYVDARNNLGLALMNQGRLDQAVDHFFQALRIDPGYVRAHNNLGNALAKQGRLDEAIYHFSKALRIKPDYVDAQYNLGVALSHKGDIKGAIARFKEVLQTNPNHVYAQKSLGKLLIINQQ